MNKCLLTSIIIIMSSNFLNVIFCCCALAGGLLPENGNAQPKSIRKAIISMDLKSASLKEAFDEIEQQTNFTFYYTESALTSTDDHKITLKVNNESVAFFLKKIANETGLMFKQVNGMINVKKIKKRKDAPFLNRRKPAPPDRVVTGKVTDENGEPLTGATVLVKDYPRMGTVTDIEGKYIVNIPDDATTLIFSFVGFLSREVDVSARSLADVTLRADLTSLEEVSVVSTGYYEVDERLNPGNIGKVDAKIIERQPVVNPLEALQGQVAGVFVQQTSGVPGAAVNINIRGQNSINNGQFIPGIAGPLPNANQPFFVIDGVPFTSSSLNADRLSLRGGNPLATLRPSDIESIEILKDADATAIYGSRGANGVILITTKKGDAGNTKVDVDVSRGIGQMVNRVDLLNTSQYLEMRREALRNSGRTITTASDSVEFSDLLFWGEDRYTDWQEALLGGTAEQTRASLSLSGGSERTRFLFSTSFFDQTNVYNYDDSRFRSVSGHFNVNHRSRDGRFRADISTTFSINDNKQNGSIRLEDVYRLPPNAPVLFDENGQLNWGDNFENPLHGLENKYDNLSRNLVTNASLSYELFSGLTLQTSLGYNHIQVNEERINPLTRLRPEEREGSTGFSELSNAREDSWTIEPQLRYNKVIGKGRLSALGGLTFQGSKRESLLVVGRDYESDLFIRNINAAPRLTIEGNGFSEYRYTAVYGRINFIWDEKYVFNLTGRRDGSSRFGPGNRFGNFGAVGVAWLFSEESFISDHLSFLSFGKLRGSYGITGNDQVGDYRYLNSYTAFGEGSNINYNDNLGILPIRAANPDYAWEESRKLEFGLELGFWDNRFQLNTSWFQNRSDNQLIGLQLSAVSGFPFVQTNRPALIENRGIEVELNTVNIRSDDLTWTSSLNFSRLRNELLSFPEIKFFAAFNNFYEVGKSLLGQKRLKSLGVNPETGQYDFVDVNGDGEIGVEDEQTFVEIAQDYFGGLNNSFTWKGFQLDVFFRFVKQDGDNFNGEFSAPGNEPFNQPLNTVNRWQGPEDISDVKKYEFFSGDHNRQYSNSDQRVVDASFIRLQNISLSWILPPIWTNKVQIERARFYVQGQNLFTFTPYEGIDPETQGLSLPPLRIITTGIQLSL